MCAPGMWPATGSMGSTSTRKRSRSRASSRRGAWACSSSAVTVSPPRARAVNRPGALGCSVPGGGGRGSPAATRAGRRRARPRRHGRSGAAATRGGRRRPRPPRRRRPRASPSSMPARRAEASKARASGSGWRPPVLPPSRSAPREVAAEVEKGGAGHMALEPVTRTRGGVGQREAAVDHDQAPLAQMRAHPVHGYQWAEWSSHEPRASGRSGQARDPRGRSRAAARLGAAEALQRRRDGSPGGRAERQSAVACIDLDVLVGRGIQASAPVDDSVTAGIDGHEADVGGERPGELLQKPAQQSPSRQERLKNPGAPSVPSRPMASTCSLTSGWSPAARRAASPA